MTAARLLRRLGAGLAASFAVAADRATSARAAFAVSTNWSGHVATGTQFNTVSGTWVQPAADCTFGVTSSVATW
jgi:hypothetical protein